MVSFGWLLLVIVFVEYLDVVPMRMTVKLRRHRVRKAVDNSIELFGTIADLVFASRWNVTNERHSFATHFCRIQSAHQPAVLMPRVATRGQNPKVFIIAKVGIDRDDPESGAVKLSVVSMPKNRKLVKFEAGKRGQT